MNNSDTMDGVEIVSVMQYPFCPGRASVVLTSHPHGRFQQRGSGFLLDAPVKEIKTNCGRTILVSDCDYEAMACCTWSIARRGRHTSYAATRLRIKRGHSVLLYMHRLILDPEKGMSVDHINCNGLDNRRENIRICTSKQNASNRRVFGKKQSRFRGVSISMAPGVEGRWVAFIGGGKKRNLGYFHDEVEAARAYDAAARKRFGEFAILNFPDSGSVKGGWIPS